MGLPHLQRYFGIIAIVGTLWVCFSCSGHQGEKAPGNDCSLWQKEWHRLDGLLDQYDTDYEKTTYLRQYCGSLIDIGQPSPETLAFYQSVPFDSFTLCRFYPLFEQDSLPAACGVTSYFFIRLAQSFGYKAYQYSFGFTDVPYERFIHSFPLVEINYQGEKRLIIQDPYLNLTFTDNTGVPLSIYELLALLQRKAYEAIHMDTLSVKTALLVADTTLYWPYLNDSCKTLMRTMLVQSDGSVLKKVPLERSYKLLMQSPCDPFEQGFTKAMYAHGYQELFLYAYTLRVNEMTGSSDVKTVQKHIDAVLRDTVINNPF